MAERPDRLLQPIAFPPIVAGTVNMKAMEALRAREANCIDALRKFVTNGNREETSKEAKG
jgi:hypothetical protein